MKVVLAVESISRPLTGIGRYSWELARNLPAHYDIESISYLSHGRWQNLRDLAKTSAPASCAKMFDKQNLIRLPLASKLYTCLAPVVTKFSLSKIKFDLFHGPNFFVPKIDPPCIVTVHDLSNFINPAWHPAKRVTRLNIEIPKSINASQIIITVSEFIRKEVIDYFSLPESKVVSILHGVSSIFQPRSEEDAIPTLLKYNLRFRAFTLCVATIEPRKNIMGLIKAYRTLPKTILQRWPLVLIGDRGWNSDEIHQEIKLGQSEGWLKYFGYVPEIDLPILYSSCRLFVYPSLYEGFGLPILEAMASGVPTLTSANSAMAEVSNGSSWLIDPKEHEDIRHGLQPCLEDENWQSNAIAAGLRRAAELNTAVSIDKTVQAYQLALKS